MQLLYSVRGAVWIIVYLLFILAPLFALLAGAAVWFYLIDGSKLDEGMVREFYAQQAQHTYERDPEALCKQMSGKYRMNIQSRIAGKVNNANYGKSIACEEHSITAVRHPTSTA